MKGVLMMERKEKILERGRMRVLKEFLIGVYEEDEMLEILREVDVKDLKILMGVIEKAIKEKEIGKFKFEFYAEGHRRMKPYVAKLTIEEGKIERTFKNLSFEGNGSKVIVRGEYEAIAGDIIEKRLDGDKSDNRKWYLVDNGGNEIEVASIHDREEKKRVVRYLKGEITANELLESVSAARK